MLGSAAFGPCGRGRSFYEVATSAASTILARNVLEPHRGSSCPVLVLQLLVEAL